MARVTEGAHDLAALVFKMESDYWLVRQAIIDHLACDDKVIKRAIYDYRDDINQFAWCDRVINTIVPLVFQDGKERHYCPICGSGIVPIRTMFDDDPGPKGYTQLGLERHLAGFGKQSQCQLMHAIQIATGYCIEHKRKNPSRLGLASF